MINKMVTREIRNLQDKIKELEIENKRIKQVLALRNNEVKGLERNLRITKKVIHKFGVEFRESNKLLEDNVELKANLNYWKETAKHWEDLYKDSESDLHYWQKYSSDLENALNNIIEK